MMEFNSSFYFSIFIFLLTYAGIMSERIPRSLCALLGAGLVVYSGLVTQEMALRHFIDFNTIGLLAGMMILICLVINIYNNNQKKAQQEEAMAKIREKEEIRRIRAEARRKQGKKHKK
jgi:cbb3-type cytochrome oxidase subunit 3